MSRLYWRLIQSTRWSLDQVDALTWGDVEFLSLGMAEDPPMESIVKQYLGVKPVRRSRRKKTPTVIDCTPEEAARVERHLRGLAALAHQKN